MVKMHFIFLSLALSLWGLSACKSSEVPIPGLDQVVVDGDELGDEINYDDLTLVWSDEFDGEKLNLTKWAYRGEGSVRNYATVDRSAVALDGEGHLALKVYYDESSGTYYIGHISTDKIFSRLYGYFECRARMNKSQGPHIGFWLQSSDMTSGTDAAKNGAEIDIFEYHRLTPNIVHNTVHWGGYGDSHQSVTHKYVNNDVGDDQFHTFGLKWTKSKYVFYVDGKVSWSTTTAVSQHPEYIILSTELTGWGGSNRNQWKFPDEVLFDYVRVYDFKKTNN